ncbi:hypothetical protein Ancab_022264, partial [Ancistrocladus abbreviatus]
MALSSVGVSRVSVFRASSSDFSGSNWVFNGYCLPSPTDASRSVQLVVLKSTTPRNSIACSAVQESSTSTVAAETETKEVKPTKKEAAPAKPKAPAKAPVKPLPQMMEEDVIPSLKATLEAQEDISAL